MATTENTLAKPDQDRPVAACRIEGLSHRHGTRTAVDNVSFSIERGQMVALVGQSGAGKTTLLRIITGMIEPSSGSVELLGRDPGKISDLAERTRLVGMMQQRLDLVSQLSARHNVDAGMLGRWNLLKSLAYLALPFTHPPSMAALASVGLEARANERVSRLSGGEQQRVALARVLVQDPQVIVADEPVASLDPDLASDLLGLLRKIATERDRTVIASIHDPVLASRHFDRVIGVREGGVQFDVPAEALTREMLGQLYERKTGNGDGDSGEAADGRLLWGI